MPSFADADPRSARLVMPPPANASRALSTERIRAWIDRVVMSPSSTEPFFVAAS